MAAVNSSICLDNLPLEIIYLILGSLSMEELKSFSYVNKHLREASLPSLFRELTINFSKSGFEKLKGISNSEVRVHVVSLKYIAPDLINPGKRPSSLLPSKQHVNWAPAILDYEYYRDIVEPDLYVAHEETADAEGLQTSSYMALYKYYVSECVAQEQIISSKTDSNTLASGIAALPKLSELAIWFENCDKKEDWLGAFRLPGFTQGPQSYTHHLRTVTKAIHAAEVAGNSLCLRTAWLVCTTPTPWMDTDLYEDEDFDVIRDLVGDFLEHVQVLGLRHNMLLLMMLPTEVPSLRQLHIREMAPCLGCVGKILDRNANINSIRLQGVGSRKKRKVLPITQSLICNKLGVPRSSVSKTDDHCPSPNCIRKDWTVMLDQRKSGTLPGEDEEADDNDRHEDKSDDYLSDEDSGENNETDDDSEFYHEAVASNSM